MLGATALSAGAAPLMAPEWAAAACEQWNQTPTLMGGMADPWVKNDGGKEENVTMHPSVDDTLHATTAGWGEMGRGGYGPMKAMMFGRLEFSGPKMEAIGVISPFEAFLLLVGQVPGEAAACPAK